MPVFLLVPESLRWERNWWDNGDVRRHLQCRRGPLSEAFVVPSCENMLSTKGEETQQIW